MAMVNAAQVIAPQTLVNQKSEVALNEPHTTSKKVRPQIMSGVIPQNLNPNQF